MYAKQNKRNVTYIDDLPDLEDIESHPGVGHTPFNYQGHQDTPETFKKFIRLDAYKNIMLSPRYAKNPFLRCVSPNNPIIKVSVKIVDTSKNIMKLATSIVVKKSSDLNLIGFSLYELIKWPKIHPATSNNRINLAELNGS